MTDEKWPFPDPRVAGMREHHERMKLLFGLVKTAEDSVAKFRLLIAAVYSARAIVELYFEAADRGQLPCTRDNLKSTLASKLPWFDLIERIRIHDFHRFGLLPPDPKVTAVFHGGPVKLHAKKGAAIYTVQDDGPKAILSGESTVVERRPLLSQDGTFFDEDTKQYVTLERIISDFVDAVPPVIADFEKEIRP